METANLIIMADDDADDCLLAEHALASSEVEGELLCVNDGIELLDYLMSRGKFAGNNVPVPALVLLDLNMPRKDGREVLKEIRTIDRFNEMPIVIFTTSREERDIVYTRKMGANDFITKPAIFDEWVSIMRFLAKKWFNRKNA